MSSFDIYGLESLTEEVKWAIVETFGILDGWTGLISFDDVNNILCSQREEYDRDVASLSELGSVVDLAPAHLDMQMKIASALQKLISDFVAVCPYATDSTCLRHSPAFVIMPHFSASVTMIVGIVFKLDNNGTTYLYCPRYLLPLWKDWFKLCGEQQNKITFTLAGMC